MATGQLGSAELANPAVQSSGPRVKPLSWSGLAHQPQKSHMRSPGLPPARNKVRFSHSNFKPLSHGFWPCPGNDADQRMLFCCFSTLMDPGATSSPRFREEVFNSKLLWSSKSTQTASVNRACSSTHYLCWNVKSCCGRPAHQQHSSQLPSTPQKQRTGRKFSWGVGG